jgi:hypothetical protein
MVAARPGSAIKWRERALGFGVAQTFMRLAGTGRCQAADFSVAQAVVAEGQDLAGDRDSGDLGAAAFGDPS